MSNTQPRKKEGLRIPQLPTRPRTGFTSVPQQLPLMRNNLQAQRYNFFQESKYAYGRQIDQNAYAHANFYIEVKKYIDDMGWMGLANLSKKNFSIVLVNEFYSDIVLFASKYDNPARFWNDILYTSFDGQEKVITKSTFGDLLNCKHYDGPYETPSLTHLKVFGTLLLDVLDTRRQHPI